MFSSFENKEFYPTPQWLVEKMVYKLDSKTIKNVLEPSAGKCDIAEYIAKRFGKFSRCSDKINVDCVELDPNLRAIIKDKGFKLVGEDFLEFNTYKRYDAIVMNPPFSNGEKHLLKAIDVMKNGGQIVCLLNYDTIRNPYSNIRKELIFKLQELNATIECIPEAFRDAERKTMVDIAFIYINIPLKRSSSILEGLKKDFRQRQETQYQETTDIAENDIMKSVITQYQFEIEAGIRLIDEFNAMQPKLLKEFDENGEQKGNILSLKFDEYKGDNADVNEYIRRIRYKYWSKFFSMKEVSGLMTEKLKELYLSKIEDLKDVEFNLQNILQIKLEINQLMMVSLDDAILELFDKFTYQHSTEKNTNIHYYNGWKTNSACKVKKKVIIPCYGLYDGRFGGWSLYKAETQLTEIEKIFSYLDGGMTDGEDCRSVLNKAKDNRNYSDIEFKYFIVSFKMKGTMHIVFKDEMLLQKFNIFGSQKKGWLPPSYGKAAYKEMNPEEKKVVDGFQGKENYNTTMANKEFYFSGNNLKLLK